MSLFQKKDPQKELLEVYDKLCDNLVGIKAELGRMIKLESRIKAQLENFDDDIAKVGKAYQNASLSTDPDAVSDANKLQAELNHLYYKQNEVQKDYERLEEKTNEMRRTYDEANKSILDLKARYQEMKIALSESKIQELSNDSFERKKNFDGRYDDFEDETYRKLFAAISEKELDSRRMNDELTNKYLPQEEE